MRYMTEKACLILDETFKSAVFGASLVRRGEYFVIITNHNLIEKSIIDAFRAGCTTIHVILNKWNYWEDVVDAIKNAIDLGINIKLFLLRPGGYSSEILYALGYNIVGVSAKVEYKDVLKGMLYFFGAKPDLDNYDLELLGLLDNAIYGAYYACLPRAEKTASISVLAKEYTLFLKEMRKYLEEQGLDYRSGRDPGLTKLKTMSVGDNVLIIDYRDTGLIECKAILHATIIAVMRDTVVLGIYDTLEGAENIFIVGIPGIVGALINKCIMDYLSKHNFPLFRNLVNAARKCLCD